MLPKTVQDIKEKLWQIPSNRNELSGLDNFGWVIEYDDVDSIANLALRKSDILNFAIFNEGNLYNNLFFKIDKKLKQSCDSNGEYCQFHFWFLGHLKSLESQDWVQEYKFLFKRKGGGYYVWDYEIQDHVFKEDAYDEPKPSYLMSAFEEVIRQMNILAYSNSTETSVILRFKEQLENFDYRQFFYLLHGEPSNNKKKKRDVNVTLNSETISEYPKNAQPEASVPVFRHVYEGIERLIEAMKIIKDKTKNRNNLNGNIGDTCVFLKSLWIGFSHLKDGAVYSLGKMMVSQLTEDDVLQRLEDLAEENFDIEFCGFEEKYFFLVEQALEELSKFLEVKRFDDGIEEWADSLDCKAPSNKLGIIFCFNHYMRFDIVFLNRL